MTIKIEAKGDKAQVTIDGVIGEGFFTEGVTSKQFREDIAALGDVTTIDVSINSPGGNVWDGIGIANILQAHGATINTRVDGLAASIASVIAVAGDSLTMGIGSTMMIHSPHALFSGNAEEMRAMADTLDKVEAGMLDIYATRTGRDRQEIKSLLDAETWFTAQEAVDAGFADEAVKSTKKPNAQASWQTVMAMFKNAPELYTPQTSAGKPQSAQAGAKPKEATMKDKAPAPAQPADNSAAIADAATKARTAERERVAEITSLCNKFEMGAEFTAKAIEDGTEITDLNAQILNAKYNDTAGSSPVPEEDERDKFIVGAEKAILFRSGLEKREAGNEFNGMTLHALAGVALTRSGISVSGMSPDQVARKVLASMTTSDFPHMLGNTAGKVLRAAYDAFPSTWASWCGVRDVSDFKQVKNIQMGAFDSLALKPEGGEYSFGSLTEESETNIALTKGKGLILSREMIVNDDLGGLNRRARYMGAAAARTINSDAYGVLNTNAALSDSVALFHATHSNLAGSGAAIAAATISAAKLAMRTQQDASSTETLNIIPVYLLVPVALEDTAKTFISSETDFSNSNSKKPNVHRNSLTVISDPKLDGTSATAWYVAADPMVAELVQGVFLDGQQSPFIDDDIDFATDALRFKIRLDYGFAAVDFRAGYKNAGA